MSAVTAAAGVSVRTNHLARLLEQLKLSWLLSRGYGTAAAQATALQLARGTAHVQGRTGGWACSLQEASAAQQQSARGSGDGDEVAV